MTSFKRWFGAGAIVLVALALIACPAMVPKVTNEIPDMQFSVADLAAGKAQTVTLANHFDVDRDPQYVAKSADPAVATATEANGILTVTPIASGTTNVTVTASKGGNDAISQAFSVTVAEPEATPPTPVNNPPVIRTYIDDMPIQVGMSKMLTLSKYYLDIDSLVVTYTAASSDESVAMISGPDANSVITITAVAEGSAQITVTAADPTLLALGLAVPQTFDVTVSATPVEPPDNNQPRQTQNIPALTGTDALKFGGSLDVDLSEYFTDDDGDDVTYTADSTDANVVTADVSGSMVTVTVVAPGIARIDVTAADPYNRSVRGSFQVEVINQGPMIQADEPTTFGPFMPGAALNIMLSRYFSDPEGESLMYTAMSDMTDYVTVSAVGADSTITITAVAAGTAMITITANDGTNDGMSHTLTVTVAPVANNPPMVKPGVAAPAVALVVEGQSNTLMLSTYFLDADADDTLTYTVTSSAPSVATASESNGVLTIMPEGAGTATIKVTASDGEATSAALDISVTVQPATNLAPRVEKELPDLKLEVGTDDDDYITIDLSEHFADDGPQLFYKVTKAETPATSGEPVIALHGATIVPVTNAPDGTDFAKTLIVDPQNPGKAVVTVTATDFRNKMVSDDFEVMVVGPTGNSDPEDVNGTIEAVDGDPVSTRLKVGETKKVIDDKAITGYFRDADFTGRNSGDTLTFSVMYFPDTVTEEDHALTATDELAMDARTVLVEFSTDTWSGSSDGKFTVSVTGLKGSTSYDEDAAIEGHAVALIATDEYGRRAAHVFQVRVNNRPKAEGAQASDPWVLSDATMYQNLIAPAASVTTPTETVPLVVEAGGYFSDADGASDLADGTVGTGGGCAIKSTGGTDGVATFTITEGSGTSSLEIRAKEVGTKSVTIACRDELGEESPSSTLTVIVTGTITGSRQ